MIKNFSFLLSLLVFMGGHPRQVADVIYYNGTVYTVDSSFSVAEAMAVKDGRIVATGKTTDLLAQYEAKQQTDLQGKFVYPGLIDAHAHFVAYGLGLQTANLVN